MADRFSGGVIAQEPIGRMGRPEAIAVTVLWVCSDLTPSSRAPLSSSMAARRPDAEQHARPTGLMSPVHNTKRRTRSNPRASIHTNHS
jgi:hypothetical protein